MPPILHSPLGPSSAERWINCPPSALINAAADSKDTVFTREGTLAHELCEAKLRLKYLDLSVEDFDKEYASIQANELYQEEMDRHTDTYLVTIGDLMSEFPNTDPQIYVEQKLRFDPYIPNGFGTADCVLLSYDTVHVIDFKYGKGVEVSPDHNYQMMIYALGAYLWAQDICDIKTVKMTIIQPRIKGEFPTFEMQASELIEWAETVVKPTAKLAAKGEGEFKEGDWCRWCANNGKCRQQAAQLINLIDPMSGKQPASLTDEEVAVVIPAAERLSKWAESVKSYALARCLDGNEIPGYKAVEGRRSREWTDQAQAFDQLRSNGVEDAMLYDRVPLTLAKVEKMLGKKRFNEICSGMVSVKAGTPTLVPESDKREAISSTPSVEDDFA